MSYVPETAHSEHHHLVDYSSTEIASNDHSAANGGCMSAAVHSYPYDSSQQAPLDETLSGSISAPYQPSRDPGALLPTESDNEVNPETYSANHTGSEFGPNHHAPNASPLNIPPATVDTTYAYTASNVPHGKYSVNSGSYGHGYPTSQPMPWNGQNRHYQTNMTGTQYCSSSMSDITQPGSGASRGPDAADFNSGYRGNGYSTSQAAPTGSQDVHYQTSSQFSALVIASSSTHKDYSSDQVPAAEAPAAYYMNAPANYPGYSQQYTIAPATASFDELTTAQDNQMFPVQVPQNYNANDHIASSGSVHVGSSPANSFLSQPASSGSKHRATHSASARAHPYKSSQAPRKMHPQSSNTQSLRGQALTRSAGDSLFAGVNSAGSTPRLSGSPTSSASLTPPVATPTLPMSTIQPMVVQSPNAEPGPSEPASPKMIRSPFPSKFDLEDFNAVNSLGFHKWFFFVTSWAARVANPSKPAGGKQLTACSYLSPFALVICYTLCCQDKDGNPVKDERQKGFPLETTSLEEYLRHLWIHRELEKEDKVPLHLRTIWFDEALDFQKSRDQAVGMKYIYRGRVFP
ncbi:hypothetical protein FRC09_018748 [Ceratobasidium sp. 395]|nr:hypothetical protein FRC09_018748 [Ceratobasidium sp. 395]